MTTAIFLILFFALLIGGLNLAPSVLLYPLPTAITASIVYIINILKYWNWLFAIDTMFTIITWMFVYEIAIWTWFHILAPLIKLIRGGTH